MTSRVARDVAPCDQLQLIGDKLHELKRLLPILHFHSLLETVERTSVDPNESDTERANTSDNGAGAMSKPKTYLRLPEIPTLIPPPDLRGGGSKALVLLGYRDCSYETHRYMVDVENMSEDDPLVLGLQQHLEQHWLRMDIQTLLNDVLDEDNTDCDANPGNNVGIGVSNGTDSYCCSRGDSGGGGDDGGSSNSLKEEGISHRHHLCHRHPLHRRHRHHPHQRNHHHHHQRNQQPCSQHPLHRHHQQHQNFVNTLSSTELNPLNARLTGVSHERVPIEGESPRMDNESSKKHELQFKLTPVSSDIIVKAPQSSPSSSSDSEAEKSSERALVTSENNNTLLTLHTTNSNSLNDDNNNNAINEISNNNDVSLKEEDPERWKQLNLSIARVTQELIVLLENEGASLSDEDEGDEDYEEEEEEEESDLVEDIDFNNVLGN